LRYFLASICNHPVQICSSNLLFLAVRRRQYGQVFNRRGPLMTSALVAHYFDTWQVPAGFSALAG